MPKKKKKHKSLRGQIAEKLIDIGLIIISVYIALAAEGWAEKRHEHKRLEQYYKSFITETREDIANLKNEQADAEKHLKYCIRHLQLIANNGPSDSILNYFGKMFNPALFGSSNMVSYQSMLASGDMKLLENLEMRSALVKLDGTYKAVKFQEDIYTSYLTNDLKNYLYFNFDLVRFKPLNSNFYKQTKYRNIVIIYQGLNTARLQHYKVAIKTANGLLKALEAELKE